MEFLHAVWKYLLVSAPYLMLGFFISGVIHQFITVEKVKKWLGGNKLINVFKAAIVGIPIPLCSCSVIPTAVTLKKSGASNASTSAFLIATPESGVDSISMTYAMMDLPMTIIRPVAAFVSAFLAGILQFFFNPGKSETQEPEVKACCKKTQANAVTKTFAGNFKTAMKFGYGELVADISLWLTIGILAGALIDFVVPDNFFMQLTDGQSRFMILLIGVPLYICATASTPVAVSLIVKGMSPGAALIMLLVGPATNISNIAVMQKYIGKKGVAINIFSIISVALVFSYIVDFMYSRWFDLSFIEEFVKHDHTGMWWQQVSAVALVLLLARGLYVEEIAPRLKKKEHHHHEGNSCH